jgi:uncharacterized protein YdeI (YjbR/CyaY-like superfamily)
MTNEAQQIYFSDRKSLREWLEKNHDKVKSIWLVHDKWKESKLSYADIVEQALCFGWIDSTLKKLNEKQNMIYLSVRKPKSIWASSNKARVEKLIKSGLMREAGLKAIQIAKENGSWSQFDVVENLVLPVELKKAFSKNKKAAENFESLSLSVRKQVLYFIYSAKQEETRKSRVEKLLPSLKTGKNPFI